MANKSTLEEEVRTMKKHFGGLVTLVKDLKAKVEKLEDKGEPMENPDLKEIIEKQRILAELIEANSDRIRCIDSEIKDIKNRRHVIPPSPEKDSDEINKVSANNSVKM